MSFRDKVVIVTGSGQGIGRCIALTYASEGAKVVVADKNSDAGSETERQIVSSGGIAFFKQTDVSHPGDIEELIAKTREMFGTIDILINNAGISAWRSPYDITVEEWDEIINTNLRGAFLFSREAARIMRKNGGGSIVNIASTRAIMSEPASEAYAASKGGIVSLTHSLAASFSPDHIRVNCISPGWIETGDYSLLRETDHNQHLSGRVGRPEDIARACLYLTADGNDFVNGINLIIDGGMTRKMIYEP
jgi:NAD(P)-dependent dehydrogenase (short-subunit alcohol dehydrogenase family)